VISVYRGVGEELSDGEVHEEDEQKEVVSHRQRAQQELGHRQHLTVAAQNLLSGRIKIAVKCASNK